MQTFCRFLAVFGVAVALQAQTFERALEPGHCNAGELYRNTVTGFVRICGPENVWSTVLNTDSNGNVAIGSTVLDPSGGITTSKLTVTTPPQAPTGWKSVYQPMDDSGFQTDALLAAYDFTTVQGATVYDVSGHGNHGTATGVTYSASGAVFDGATSRIAIPPVAKDGTFTVIAVAWSNVQTTDALWSETIPADGGSTSILLQSWRYFNYRNASFVGAALDNSASSYGPCCAYAYTGFPDAGIFHAFEAQFDGANTSSQVMDVPGTLLSVNNSTVSIGATTAGMIGAQQYGVSSYRYYWPGTLAYLAIWRGTYTQPQLRRLYAYIQSALRSRNVRLPAISLGTQAPGPVLVRQGVAITNGGEPSVIYDTANCQTTAGPCFRAFYQGELTDPNLSYELYAESPGNDGVNFTKVGPITTTGAARIPGLNGHVQKVNGTYYYYTPAVVAGGQTQWHQVSVFTSPNGYSAWTYRGVALSAWGGTGPDAGGAYNASVSYDAADGWKMLYDCTRNYNSNWTLCSATSTDGLTWTKGALNPIAGEYALVGAATPYGSYGVVCSAPDLHRINGAYWAFGHNGVPPSDTYLCYWGDGKGYLQAHPTTKFLARGTSTEEAQTYSQIQDASVVEANGKTYIYYDVNDNGNGGGAYLNIKVATANMTLAQLVATLGVATATTP